VIMEGLLEAASGRQTGWHAVAGLISTPCPIVTHGTMSVLDAVSGSPTAPAIELLGPGDAFLSAPPAIRVAALTIDCRGVPMCGCNGCAALRGDVRNRDGHSGGVGSS